MDKVIVILVFGVVAMSALLAFALHKVKSLENNNFYRFLNEYKRMFDWRYSIKMLYAINADFLERRNEFWQTLGQFITIIVIITLLVVLLLLDKISSEAALPLIAGLGSFGIGKGITTIKNNPASDNDEYVRPQ
jgi:hypothetical protein